jgi:release factor glutamine methyltransferase
MLTVLESLRLSTEYLEKKGVDSPRLNAELLLADILGLKRLELYLQFERPLSESEKNKYREYLARRGNREPLQYILGYAEFMGEKFKVTRDVLIPRPETELLVEKIANENALFNGVILDVGTGSGNIAIMLAKYLPEARICATDISSSALEVAKENESQILGKNEIRFFVSDLFSSDFVEKCESVDILVSNPPYISAEEFEKLQPEVKDYEPQNALTDGRNGLSFYEALANKGKELLAQGGKIYFELGADEAEKVAEILKRNGFEEIEITKDYAGTERIIKATNNKGK